MYQQMSLAQGDGILITDDSEYSYRLERMPGGAAETNSTNRMVLKVSQNTGRSEAILRGFYHVLYQDMQIELPPVTTPTTYIIALTYDPRHEEEPAGPIRVEVHQNALPRTHGRKHIVLHTVRREPNQLLTQAVVNRGRQYISPTITVASEAGLPEPTDVLYGTIAVVRNRTSGGDVIPGTSQLFESRGIHGWHNLLGSKWENLSPQNGWETSPGTPAPTPRYKIQSGVAHLQGRVRNGPTTRSLIVVPASARPIRDVYVSAAVNPISSSPNLVVGTDGSVRLAYTDFSYSWISFDGISYPLD
jgi:hypothetical protein